MWKKNCRGGRATVDNMAQARCMLDNNGNKCTHRRYNIFGFSTAAMVVGTGLDVTLEYIDLLVFLHQENGSCFINLSTVIGKI